LDFGTISDVNQGYRAEAAAAKMKFERKALEEEKDWRDVSSKLTAAQKRLQMAEILESLQREKYNNERNRHRRGRTTTFLVLQFEQDYALAQLARLRTQSEILNLISNMKTFGGTP
jgi:outer membrane protein TolC